MTYAFEKEKLLFIHLTKCGGIFVANFLKNMGLEQVVEGRSSLVERLSPENKKWFTEQHDHERAFDEKKYEKYFKFTCVRNPYSRLVSAYHFNKQRVEGEKRFALGPKDKRTKEYADHYKDFDSFISFLHESASNQYWSGFITPLNDELFDGERFLLDYYFKIENKMEGLREVCRRGGIPYDEKDPRLDVLVNSTLAINKYSETDLPDYYLDSTTMRKFMDMYAKDFEKFGYSKDLADTFTH